MIDILDIRREEQYFQKNKEAILYHYVTWTDVAAKTLQTDGSFADATNTTYTIRATLEPISTRIQNEEYKKIQGLVENSSHSMYTLKNYDINEQDIITHDGKNYRVSYKFPNQYDMDFREYLLVVED